MMAPELEALARDLRSAVDYYDAESALNLCANETLLSNTARRYLCSRLGDCHQEGTSTTRTVDGRVAINAGFTFKALPRLDSTGHHIHALLRDMFEASHVDLRLSSGMHAMLCTLLSATSTNDWILSLHPHDGGHFATRFIAEQSGRRHRYVPWDNDALDIDYTRLNGLARTLPIKAVYLDQGAPLYPLDLSRLRDILGPTATIVYDASHTLGLIAGGQFQSPLAEGADILQGNTHKTFPGPQKACVAFRDATFGEHISKTISSGLVSNQHTHHLLALFAATIEMALYGTEFASQMIWNAQALTSALERHGFIAIRRPGEDTKSSQVLIHCRTNEEAMAFSTALGHAMIFTNSKCIYRRPAIRLGTQDITRRGMKEPEMLKIASMFFDVFEHRRSLQSTRTAVHALLERFPHVLYSLDSPQSQRHADARSPH